MIFEEQHLSLDFTGMVGAVGGICNPGPFDTGFNCWITSPLRGWRLVLLQLVELLYLLSNDYKTPWGHVNNACGCICRKQQLLALDSPLGVQAPQ